MSWPAHRARQIDGDKALNEKNPKPIKYPLCAIDPRPDNP
jgi:hypothetical protein